MLPYFQFSNASEDQNINLIPLLKVNIACPTFLKGRRWHKLKVYATGFPLKGIQLEMHKLKVYATGLLKGIQLEMV